MTPGGARGGVGVMERAEVERRALERMPGKAYTLEAVHAWVREHGTAEECEAITPDALGRPATCPACGVVADSTPEELRRQWWRSPTVRWWHSDCLARVQARAPKVEAPPPDGVPGEPRPFQVGDRVSCCGEEYVVNRVHPSGHLDVKNVQRGDFDFEHQDPCQFTLVTPATEARGEPPAVVRARELLGPGYEVGPDPDDGYGDWVQVKRGARQDSFTSEQVANEKWFVATVRDYIGADLAEPQSYEHEGATLTNPIGLPIAPGAGIALACQCGAQSDFTQWDDEGGRPVCIPCYESGAWPGRVMPKPSVALPFDAFLAEHQAAQERAEVPRFDVGDEVVGASVDDEDITARGIVVSQEDYVVEIRTRQGHHPELSAWRCELLRKAEPRGGAK